MFTPVQRIVIIALFAALGAVRFAQGRVPATIFALIVCAAMIYGYFRSGTVVLAFRALRRGDPARAEKRLAQIRFPNRLSLQSLTYYFWVKGALADARGDLEPARRHFIVALKGRPRTSHDRCVLACCVADLLIRSDEKEQAKEYLEAARKRVHRSELDPVIERLEKAAQS